MLEEKSLKVLGRIDVGVCYTPGARSRRWCGWWGRRVMYDLDDLYDLETRATIEIALSYILFF